jgi:autotransporter-associated beta strand protein
MVSGGILRLTNSGALPADSNLVLDGGVVELASGDVIRDLGSGAGQVQFTANGGGFAAVGANRVVNLSSSATLTWGSGSFLPNGAALTLGTWSANATVDFQNAIDLGSGTQTIVVRAGNASLAAQLSAVLSGNASLAVVGDGALELTASNTYTGPTTVSGATLRLSNSGALPGGIGAASTGGNLTLDGGRLELAAGDFTRSAGSGAGQVQFTTYGGGFSAVGANRVVNLGGNSATLTWDNGGFLPNGAPLMLGTAAADATVDFQNPLVLGSGPQTVLVAAGCGTAAVDAKLSGAISGSGGLTIMGDGTLLLSGTDNTYSGGTTVDSGTLIVGFAGALPDGSSLSIGAGAPPTFDSSPAAAAAVAPLDAAQSIAAVPEPSALVLLVAALALGIGVIRKGCALRCRPDGPT